jgi:hypothetical protein
VKTLERTKSPKLTWYNFYPTFDNVMVLLPNIQELKLSPGHLRSLWETIITELGAGKWPLLKKTPGPIELDDGDKYSELVFAQKNIVESLHLWVEKPRSCGNWIKKLTKKLHEFERLNHLHLRLHKTVMVSDIEAVLAGHYYSNLESITFGVYDSIQKPGRTFEGLLDDVDYNDRNCEPSNQPYPNIKSFKGGKIIFTEYGVRYVMHRFPRLQVLTW